MTDRRTQRGFFLIAVMTYLVLIAALATVCTFAFTKSLALQKRVTYWANDDAVAREILQRIRRDARDALDARLAEGQPAVVLQRAEGEVRYVLEAGCVRRVQTGPAAKANPPRQWQLPRTRLRWSLERIDGRPAMLWTEVRMESTTRGKRHLVARYCRGAPIGSRLRKEVRP